MRELKDRMRVHLGAMKRNAETGRGKKPWLGGGKIPPKVKSPNAKPETRAKRTEERREARRRDPYSQYKKAKDEARRELARTEYFQILWELEDELDLGDQDWDIVY